MPLNEIETHPYLDRQIDLINVSSRFKYCKLIVGTFPIYAISNSTPVESKGENLRANWNQAAFFKYFYGSKENSFWDLLASSFGVATPITVDEALTLINDQGILITDIFKCIQRNGYSPEDSGLKNASLNIGIESILNNFSNLKFIYFTSIEAKRQFCKIFYLNFTRSRGEEIFINGKCYQTIVLPTPSGNGRSVTHYFFHFPLNNSEAFMRTNGKTYALTYRKRYYRHHLNFPCIER